MKTFTQVIYKRKILTSISVASKPVRDKPTVDLIYILNVVRARTAKNYVKCSVGNMIEHWCGRLR